MSSPRNVTVPVSPGQLESLDEIVAHANSCGAYPRATRASVMRGLIEAESAHLRKAKAKRPEAAA